MSAGASIDVSTILADNGSILAQSLAPLDYLVLLGRLRLVLPRS